MVIFHSYVINYQRIPYSSILAISGAGSCKCSLQSLRKGSQLTLFDLGAQVILQSHGKVHNHQKHTVADTTNHWV